MLRILRIHFLSNNLPQINVSMYFLAQQIALGKFCLPLVQRSNKSLDCAFCIYAIFTGVFCQCIIFFQIMPNITLFVLPSWYHFAWTVVPELSMLRYEKQKLYEWTAELARERQMRYRSGMYFPPCQVVFSWMWRSLMCHFGNLFIRWSLSHPGRMIQMLYVPTNTCERSLTQS